MRPSTLFIAVFAALASAVPQATRTTSAPLSIDGPYPQHPPSARDLHQIHHPSTNAERFSAGLPPLAPKRRFHEARFAHRPRSSPGPPITGVIEAKKLDGTSLGYIFQSISPSTPRYGLGSLAVALTFTVTPDANDNPTTQANIRAHGTDEATFPYMGGVVGPADTDNDIGPGGYNYILLTDSAETQPGQTPSPAGNAYDGGDCESAIWIFDSTNNGITGQWINTDGSKPTSILVYLPSADGVLITGDFTAFSAAFPGGEQITFTLVPQ